MTNARGTEAREGNADSKYNRRTGKGERKKYQGEDRIVGTDRQELGTMKEANQRERRQS